MIRGAVFDMDGTLLDSMEVWEHAGEWYLNRLGYEAEPGLGEALFSMSMQEGAAYLKENYGLKAEPKEIMDGINQVVCEFYEKEVPLKAGARHFLEVLRSRGIRITVATSTDRIAAEAAFRRLGLFSLVERIFTCTEVGQGKSKPDIYLAAARWMGADPEEIWVFEDALYALLTAKKAGFHTAGVFDESSRIKQEEIRSQADIYLETLQDPVFFLRTAGK